MSQKAPASGAPTRKRLANRVGGVARAAQAAYGAVELATGASWELSKEQPGILMRVGGLPTCAHSLLSPPSPNIEPADDRRSVTPPPAGTARADRSRRRTIHHVTGLKAAGLWLLSLGLRAWGATLRMRMDHGPAAAAARGHAPVVVVFWHNRLFFAPRLLRLLRPNRSVVALVSASRDGALFARFVSFLGVKAVRGSSSRLGREAVHGLVQALQAGQHVAVTPDGPRGPCYEMKPGALLAARRAGSPLLLVGIQCTQCWSLRTWDRFRIPWPFARVTVRCACVEPRQLGREDDALPALRAQLLALNDETAGHGTTHSAS